MMYRTIALFGLMFSSLIGAVEEPVSGNWYRDTAAIMGTNIEVQLWAATPEQGAAAVQQVFIEMERINQLMSPYIETSELSRLNQNASKHPIQVSSEMFELLKTAEAYSQLTNGAFDITFASVGFLFNYRERVKPTTDQVQALAKVINYTLVKLDSQTRTVRFTHPDVKIDLGGIAKGHAVDNAIELIRSMGIKHAMVTAGGDTRLLGDRLGRDWVVGIRDPRQPDKQAVLLPLSNTAMSTSGDYERFFEEDGVRYHHILSPKTGQSPAEVQSVSIISDSATANDALSTAVFVLGVTAGLNLVNQLGDTEAIIMDSQRKLHYSDGLAQQQ
ncbi:FAD:protein FMN transferase [Alteromonas flava]|uniref:FAD:protein FMN transferase n=1 Tax=Alteromonas flava TaxID=2048003 RepID=UPI001F0BA026|nr:FAD:protein FMN transferase [Alteromonas flava]